MRRPTNTTAVQSLLDVECSGGAPAEVYSSEFFKTIENLALDSARQVAPLVLELVNPRSVVDLGCGTGAWLSVFKELGVARVCGVDGDWVDRKRLLIAEDEFVPADLGRLISVETTFDLAVSLEVAEHLPPQSGVSLVESLTTLAPVVLFSAAIPNQGGVRHVNEQWPGYWIERFQARGFAVSDCLRHRLWNNPMVAKYYAQNVYLFVRDDDSPEARRLRASSVNAMPKDIVHPELWQEAHARVGRAEAHAAELQEYCARLMSMAPGYVSLKRVLRAAPSLVAHAIKARCQKLMLF